MIDELNCSQCVQSPPGMATLDIGLIENSLNDDCA